MDKKIIFLAILILIILGAALFVLRASLMREISAVKHAAPAQNAPVSSSGNEPGIPEAAPQKENAGAAKGIDGSVFEHATADFKLAYPVDWASQADITPEIVAFFLSPQENENDAFGENVIVRYVSATSTMELQQFTDVMLEQERARFPTGSFTLLSREPASLSGLPAERLIYKVAKAVNDETDGKAISLITVKGNRGYAVTYGAAENAYDKFIDGANIIFNSLEIKD